MSEDNNPFGALDKVLFSSAQPEKKQDSSGLKENPSLPAGKSKPARKKKVSPKRTATNKRATSSQKQSTEPSTGRSTGRSTEPSTQQLSGKVVDRPVCFYVPEIIHHKLDEAVRYYLEKHNLKANRSAIVSALLADRDNWTDKALDRLLDKVVGQLTNRLMSR